MENLKKLNVNTEEEISVTMKEIIKEEKKEFKPNPFKKTSNDECTPKETKLEIISLTVNIRKRDLEEFLKESIHENFELSIKEFDAAKELNRVPEQDRDALEETLKKIVAYADDESFLSNVPVLAIASDRLKKKVQDVNLAMLGRDIDTTSIDSIKSPYVLKHIVEKSNMTSEVYLDTATVLVHCALNGMYGVLDREKVLSRRNPYAISVAYNNDGCYTLTFRAKGYVAL